MIHLICSTIKKGTECLFMTAKGCSYKDGMCYEVIEKCEGCKRKTELPSGWYCAACPEPSIKWKDGNCNLASHIVFEPKKAKAKINPLKASKRSQ